MYYDYRCNKCEKTFEKKTTLEKRNEAVCPHCGATASRLPSNYTFKMKV